MIGLRCADNMLSRFDTKPECDRQDGQTELLHQCWTSALLCSVLTLDKNLRRMCSCGL